MEKSQTLGTNTVLVCYLLLKEANIHINLICFDSSFHHSRINVVTSAPPKNGPIYLLMGLSSIVGQNSSVFFLFFFDKLLLNCCTFEKLTENIWFDCFGERFVLPFSKKGRTFRIAEKPGKWDKHGHDFLIFSQATLVTGQTWYRTSAYHLSALGLLLALIGVFSAFYENSSRTNDTTIVGNVVE